MNFKFFLVVGDEVGMGGEAVVLGAVGFDEFLSVFFFEAYFQLVAAIAVRLVKHGVIDETLGHDIGGDDPAFFFLLQLNCQAHH